MKKIINYIWKDEKSAKKALTMQFRDVPLNL